MLLEESLEQKSRLGLLQNVVKGIIFIYHVADPLGDNLAEANILFTYFSHQQSFPRA